MVSRFLACAAMGSVCFVLGGCGNSTPSSPVPASSLRPPVYDADFRKLWDDGAAEVSTYETLRFRAGALRKGTATSLVRRTLYSEDERVPITDAKTQPDSFPALQMIWIERYSEGAENCEEMTTSVVALAPVDGRVSGAETKAEFSIQSWEGQLFHELLFDATGVRSHQYSYLESEGDEQITMTYPADGIAGDALWLWARGISAPALHPGERRNVDLLPRLRDARSQHHSLAWKTAALARAAAGTWKNQAANVFTVTGDAGYSEDFYVESASPFKVLHWEASTGERADFVSSRRLKSWSEGVIPNAHESRSIP